MKVCGVILSGGKSSRMGTNKSLLPIGEKRSVEHVADTLREVTDDMIIIANEENTYDFLGIEQYKDRYTDKGPLGGLEAALYYKEADAFIVSACDMPFVHPDIYRYLYSQLKDHEAVVPIFQGQMHPLSSVYRKSVHQKVETQIKQDNLRVRSFFDQIDVHYIEAFPSISASVLHKHFFNMNHPNEYEQAKEL